MNSRACLAALLSSLVSEILLLLLLLFPSPNPLGISNAFYLPDSASQEILFPLLLQFVSTSEIAAALSLLPFPRKRKRARFQEPDAPDGGDEQGPELGQLGRVDSSVPRTPDSFKQSFKMNSSTFEWLCGLLEPLLDCRDPIDSPLNLTAETRLGIGLFRFATGADYEDISRRFHVSETVSRFCVKQLCRVLCTNFRFWVGFPSPAELDAVSTQFETLSGLPNCCGILSCLRFNTISTSISGDISQEETIAAQVVVDSSSKILSVIAGFRGNKNDVNILRNSTLYKDIEKGSLLNSQPTPINGVSVPQYLVGFGDYPLMPWLLGPFFDPDEGSDEEHFNNVLHLMSAPVRKAMASLRNWGVLSKPIEAELKAAVAYIGACSILHNMMLAREDYSALCDAVDDYSMPHRSSSVHNITVENHGFAIRGALARRAREFGTLDNPTNRVKVLD